jgi:phosphoribosylaminoimidazole (AIR) synthetase
LPSGVGAVIEAHPPLPPVFKWIKKVSGLGDSEMLRTFNCGVGMVLIVERNDVEQVKTMLATLGEHVYELGYLQKGTGVHVQSFLI